ncbi:MAG: formylmethanofuran dehydrogenase [Deltaproteobacteria bacterium]|nr:formylmethanofuran dehydrogenase [Deltaproteobacteria bacterium]
MNDINHDGSSDTRRQLPEDLKRCIAFHGHICPGLVYGYMIAKQAKELLGLRRSKDEEVVVISENDTCAVDALQVLLGTTTGKGNLILKDYGKNAFTVLNRSDKRAFRFSRQGPYEYEGEHKEEFDELEEAFAAGRATVKQRMRQKLLKALDLLAKPFDTVFETIEVKCSEPPYASLAPSKACSRCAEMTMATRMIETRGGDFLCIPCAREEGLIGSDISQAGLPQDEMGEAIWEP